MKKLTKTERKNIYEVFENWVKEEWIYNVPSSLFANSLELRKSKGFSSYATQTESLDSILGDKKAMLKEFIAFSLNGSASGLKKWIVNSDKISNVFIDNKENKILVLFDWDTYAKNAFDVKGDIEQIERIFFSTSEQEMKNYGFASSLISLWREHVNAMLEKGIDPEKRFEFKFAFISRRDYAETHDINGKTFDVWGLPSIFKNIEYKPFINHPEDIEFNIEQNISKGHSYIDLTKSVTGKSDRVIIAPIKVSALFDFVRKVEQTHGSIDSLFTLNVRDRKSTKGKVSQAIIKSLEEEPQNFLMLNNGITAIVDGIVVTQDEDMVRITFRNIKIINGQQTTNTIYQNYKSREYFPKSADSAYVMLKAYAVEKGKDSAKLFNDISNASNQQNAIKSKDLMSTREFNRLLSEELVNLGVHYQYRDGASDHASQFKGMPKITLSDLVKMHYIFLTGEVWARAGVGSVFDSITGLVDSREGSKKSEYASMFNSFDNTQLAHDLRDIATYQLFFKSKADDLNKEKQGLDLLVYIALVLNKHGHNYKEMDVPAFAKLCEYWAGPKDRNNFYKSKKEMIFLLDKLFDHYGLQDSDEANRNKKLLKEN